MANKFEKLVEETVVEVAPIVGIAARAIGSAGKSIARGIVGPAPTAGARNAGRRQAANRKSNINKQVKGATRRDWLKSNDSDTAAKIAKETIRNNKGTGGSNVVTSGNKTTNHTSNYNQVRKADLQVYSATKQGQPPVKDDEADNPLVTQTSQGNQGSTSGGKSPSNTSVSGKFRSKVASSAKKNETKSAPTPAVTLPPDIGPTDGSRPTINNNENNKEKNSFRSKVAGQAKQTTRDVSNVIMKHLSTNS